MSTEHRTPEELLTDLQAVKATAAEIRAEVAGQEEVFGIPTPPQPPITLP